MTAKEKLEIITKALDAKLAKDIRILHVSDLTVLTEYFVIANGTSTTQVRALIDEVDFKMEEAGEKGRIEGKASDWQLLDFSDVIVHIFTEEAREQYNIEKLWADAEEVEVTE